MESKGINTLLDCNDVETRRLQAGAKCRWINGNQRVSDMDQPREDALQAVASNKGCPRHEDPPHLTQKLVLQLAGRHVMQHRE